MLYPIILTLALVAVLYLIQSQFNVIEELRRPFKVLDFIRSKTWLTVAALFLVLLSIITYFMWPALLGEFPIGGDHHVHLAKIRVLNSLLEDWQLRGWNHDFFAGYPYGYLYSPLAEFIPISINAITFGFIDLDHSYSLTLFLTYLLKAVSGFLFGYRAFGAGTGFLTALFLVLDPGEVQQGGRSWFLGTGVWVADLAISLNMIGLSYVREIWTSPTKKGFLLFTLFTGLAFLIHPLPIILVALTALTSFIAYASTQSIDFSILRRSLFRFTVALLIAFMIGSFFLLPFFTYAEYARDFGAIWHSIEGLGSKIANLTLFGKQNPIILIFGCLSMMLLALSNKFWPVFISITTLLSFVIFSTDIFQWLPFLKKIPFISHVELPRTAVFIKYFFFCGAAFLLTKFFSSLKSLSDIIKIESNKAKSIARVIIFAGLLSLIIYPMFTTNKFEFLKNQTIYSGSWPTSSAMKKMSNWLAKRTKSKSGLPVRTALIPGVSGTKLFDLYRHNQIALYNTDYTPATNFTFKPESTNVKLMSHMNVRYIVTDGKKLSKARYRLRSTFKPFHVYENKKWLKTKPWRIITGSGRIRNLKIANDKISFSTSKNARGRAMLFITHFQNWKLKINGEPEELKGQSYLGIKNTSFMTFKMKPGKYEITYERSFIDLVALLLSVCGLFFLTLVIFVNKFSFRIL